jgi:hypothetical protein
LSCVGATQPLLTRIKKDTHARKNTLANLPFGTKMKFLFALFVIAILVLPVIGFVDGLGYKKNDNEYLDSARWSDGK